MHMFLLIVSFVTFRIFSTHENNQCEKYQKRLLVNHKYSNNCTEDSQQISCSTISAALSVQNLTNICIVIEDNQTLENVNIIKDVINLTVTGVSSSIEIDCTPNFNSGILIYNAKKLLFKNFTIKHCGSASEQVFGNNAITLSSAFFFSYIVDVIFINVHFTNSIGYSVVLLNGKGNISFDTVIFQNNTILLNESLEHQSGGGLLIWYSHAKSNETANINIENCTFQWNTGEMNSNSTVKSLLNESDVPFGHGGGLGVFFTDATSQNNLSIANCKFLYNKGLCGGGLFVFQEFSNSILIKESVFFNNHASLYGGGSRILEVNYKSKAKQLINNVVFENCTFYHNNSTYGGALSFDTNDNKKEKIISIKKCNFFRNSAILGSAIYLHRTSLVLSESKFSHNNFWHFDQTLGQGAIYTYSNKIHFLRENLFENNSNTAIILENAVVFVSGKLYFKENKGNKGGALGLYTNSKIIINHNTSLVSFINNSALQGGAIFAEQSVSCTFYLSYKENENCFFSKKYPSAKLEYSNNIANYKINDIFVSTLKCCHFNASEYLGTNNYITEPVAVYVFKEDFTNIYPGKKINPTILLVDEFNQSSSSSIDVYLNGSLQSFVVKENKISLQIFGQKESKYSIIFMLKNINQYSFEFNLTYCPLGYSFQADDCVCNAQNLLKGIICNKDGTISLFGGLYVDYNQSAIRTDNETTHICPYGYCQSCQNLTCSFGPDNQCANGRKGFLCSKCPANKTVEFGGEHCVDKCSWFNLFYILPGVLLIFAFVCLAIACLNICIYDLWLNSWIYFYQVIQYHVTASQNSKDTFANTYLQSIVNFRGVHLHFCLVKEWNDLDKLAFNYLIPMTMFLSVILIAKWKWLYRTLRALNNKVICFFVLKNQSNEELTENSCIRVYLLISVLAYADITRITLSILHPVEYNGVKNHVYLYAVQKFYSGRHLAYATIAIIIFFFVVLLWPLLLITTVWWMKLKVFQYFGRWYPIFSAFHGPFRDHFQWFASLYYFSRLAIIAFGIFIDDKLIQLVCVTIVSLIVLVVFALSFPYKNTIFNYFDVFLLSLLVLIGTISAGKYGLREGKYNSFMFQVTEALMYLPCLIIFRWLYCFIVWINLKEWYLNRIQNKGRYTTFKQAKLS